MPVAFIDWMFCRPGDRLDDLGYLARTWCIEASGNVPVDAQAVHLRLSEQAVRDSRYPAARRAWADEAIRWAATADQEHIRAHERTLLAALRRGVLLAVILGLPKKPKSEVRLFSGPGRRVRR